MKKQEETEGGDRSAIIDAALMVITVLTYVSAMVGVGCVVCVILTLVYAGPYLSIATKSRIIEVVVKDSRSLNTGGGDRAAIIDAALPVITVLTYVSAMVGVGCVVCGILTLVYAGPHFRWPFTSGSGIWAGLTTLLQGLTGFMVLKNFNKSFPQATKSWMVAFYTIGIIGMSVAPQHLTYSIIGLTRCAGRETDGQGASLCSIDHRDALMVTQALGVVFASVMEAVAITTLVYMLTKRRLVHLTGGQYGGNHCRCYSDCYGNKVSYNDI